MFKIHRLVLALLLMLAVSTTAFAQKYIITGKLSGFKNGTKVALMDEEQENVIKATTLKNGSFTLNGILPNAPLYLPLVFTEGSKQFDCTVFVGEGKVIISGDKKSFPYDVKISGSAEQDRYNAYQASFKSYKLKLAEFMQLYRKAQGDTAKQNHVVRANNAFADELHIVERKTLLTNATTYYAANEIYDYLPTLPMDSIKLVYANFPNGVKNSVYGKRVATYIAVGDTLKVNDQMFDFEAYDKAGVKQKLSNFNNKYILLDFTSVHCGPCVESTPELRAIATKYRNQLNIVSFTYDKKAEWLQGIKDGQVTWISLNDYKGNYSNVPLKYGVQAYPTFLIIKPGGIIAEKWLGYPDKGSVEKHLAKYLSPLTP